MAHIKANKNKSGKIISYRIWVSDGYTGKGEQRLQTMTWKVPDNMTEKQAAKAVQAVAFDYEEKVKHGVAGSQRNLKLYEFSAVFLCSNSGISC